MSAPYPSGRLNTPHQNREAWLTAAVELLRPTLAKVGELPQLRVACGFPSKGGLARRRRTVGQCWSPACSADRVFEIFISPTLDDECEVIDTLIHELLHAVVGTEHGHRGPFKRAMGRIGLIGPPTHSRLGDELALYIRGSILPALGPYPHARLDTAQSEKVQSTRLIKAKCDSCGYIVRVTRQWINVGLPLCSCNGEPMIVEWRT